MSRYVVQTVPGSPYGRAVLAMLEEKGPTGTWCRSRPANTGSSLTLPATHSEKCRF